MVINATKKALGKVKEKVSNQFIRSPQELSERMEEVIDEYESETGQDLDHIKIYVETLPMVYQLYGNDKALANHIESAIRQSNDELGEKIRGLWTKYKCSQDLNISKSQEDKLREIVADE